MISENFHPKQKVFLDFVLSHYVAVGVEELDQAKLTPLLKLKYHCLLYTSFHGDRAAVGQAERLVLLEFLDATENVVPASGVKPG